MNRTHTLSVPAGIRRLLLAWMIAVTAEYLRLPREMRILSDNALTTSLSPVRTTLITVLIAMLLWGLSLFCRTQAAERWGIVAMLSLSSALFCTSPFSPVFGGICLLLIAVAALLIALAIRPSIRFKRKINDL